MGLDVGDRRIGVALSDPLGILASPLTVMERTNETADVEKIVGFINQHQVKEVIIGLPLSLSGVVGEQAEKVHIFVNHLTQHTGIPLKMRDERLSTVSAKRLMRESRTKKTKEKVPDDAFAAAVILQSYLDEIGQA
ncbi:MAG: Holliday junction resolvase RuvX [Dehalococcoidales bacterium]|nr:Holliday junction resolvase RuvX [Dehalococcoidales bacterium]